MTLMTGLGIYMWAQVRRHEKERGDEDEPDRGPDRDHAKIGLAA